LLIKDSRYAEEGRKENSLTHRYLRLKRAKGTGGEQLLFYFVRANRSIRSWNYIMFIHACPAQRGVILSNFTWRLQKRNNLNIPSPAQKVKEICRTGV